MDKLMRWNGASSSGWTDGLHPANHVTFQYINLALNAMADLNFDCVPGTPK
jgi:hypothetical protein